MSRRKTGKSGIRLYEAETKHKSERSPGGGPVLILVRGAVVCLLAVSWWRTFFDVFPAEISQAWLYAFLFPLSVLGVLWASLSVWKKGLAAVLFAIPAGVMLWRSQSLAAAAVNYLANAYLRIHNAGTEPLLLYSEPAVSVWIPGLLTALATVPLLLIWSCVLVRNRGKSMAVLLLLLPAALAAVESYFPSVPACWFLIFSAGIYFAVCGGNSGKAAISGAASAVVCILVLFLASNAIAKPVEEMKTAENGVYRKARTAVREGVVSKLADLTGNSEKQKEDKAESGENPEEKDQEGISEEAKQDVNIADQEEAQLQEEPSYLPELDSPGGFLDGGPRDLKSIASFSPGDGKGIIVKLEERPIGTYYYPERYGSVYDGHSWGMESLTDDVLPDYSQYPSELKRLVKLCRTQEIGSLEDAARFIQSEFKENTVYDYNPGSTPADQDFAEYFLFENQKGFCVHFATTAALMYRILGYQARYAEGYAIPSSAFEKQKDGTYAAEVTGEMGHAWCETYADGWQIREHTLPYTGDDIQAVPPASDSRENAPSEVKAGTRILVAVLTITAMLLILILMFLIQAAVRRKQRMTQCSRYRQGKGILALYQSLYETALFLGMEKTEDPLSTEAFESVKSYISEISAGEWQWIQDIVWQSVFDKSPPAKEEHERLYRMVKEAAGKIRSGLKGWEKIKYRQFNCLGW